MNPNWVGKPKKNYPYIGDRQLEPDDEPEVCEYCNGSGFVPDGSGPLEQPCFACQYDPDPGEPNEDPE